MEGVEMHTVRDLSKLPTQKEDVGRLADTRSEDARTGPSKQPRRALPAFAPEPSPERAPGREGQGQSGPHRLSAPRPGPVPSGGPAPGRPVAASNPAVL